jgi:DNA-binding response OmpR family regulator
MKILIVDDESQIRGMLSTLFKRAGFAVEAATNGAAAISLCQTDTFDVVLSDVMMPQMNGHELAQWMAVHAPTTITVLMTGYDPGCDGCLYTPHCAMIAKPFVPKDLLDTVHSLLAQRATNLPIC